MSNLEKCGFFDEFCSFRVFCQVGGRGYYQILKTCGVEFAYVTFFQVGVQGCYQILKKM